MARIGFWRKLSKRKPRHFWPPWLLSVSTVKDTTTIQSLAYSYDALGRITAVTSSRTGVSWTYAYDDLGRLTSATNTDTPALSQSFAYDLAGNVTENSAVGAYSYPAQGSASVRPHAVTTAGNWSFDYDQNGNQVSRLDGLTQDRAIVYDPDNRPVEETAGGGTVACLQGPDGARLRSYPRLLPRNCLSSCLSVPTRARKAPETAYPWRTLSPPLLPQAPRRECCTTSRRSGVFGRGFSGFDSPPRCTRRADCC